MAIVSIVLNGIILLGATIQMGYIKNERYQAISKKIWPFIFWWLVGNTIANLFSKSMTEVLIFTPILLILTVCSYRIMNKKQGDVV